MNIRIGVQCVPEPLNRVGLTIGFYLLFIRLHFIGCMYSPIGITF